MPRPSACAPCKPKEARLRLLPRTSFPVGGMRAELENLETALGRGFTNRDLLVRALTHSSRVHENQAESDANGVSAVNERADNERMEFLGDAVLGFLVSEALVARFPSYPEG